MRNLLIASLLALSACGPAGFGGSDDNTDLEAPPAPAQDPAIAAFDAAYDFPVTQALVDGLVVPEGLSVAYNDDETMTVSGTSAESSPGGTTGGAAITIGSETEAALSEKVITVKIVAKGEPGSVLSAAYSTNDVGNSGWRTFDMTDSFAEYTFEYSVPAVNRGRDDFLGLSPSQGSVTIAAIGIDAAEPEPVEEEPVEAETPADEPVDAGDAEEAPVEE